MIESSLFRGIVYVWSLPSDQRPMFWNVGIKGNGTERSVSILYCCHGLIYLYTYFLIIKTTNMFDASWIFALFGTPENFIALDTQNTGTKDSHSWERLFEWEKALITALILLLVCMSDDIQISLRWFSLSHLGSVCMSIGNILI